MQNGNSDEAKRLAASALSAVKEAATLAAASGRGKVEITEVRDFGGEAIEMKKLVDADSREASDKAKVQEGPPAADWGDFKEGKGLEEELDAYKKSGNQYLDKRADYREFERERDARLALQAKRKPDTDDKVIVRNHALNPPELVKEVHHWNPTKRFFQMDWKSMEKRIARALTFSNADQAGIFLQIFSN
ncbi:hypothetical protein RJ639_007490 [Escallonia herrerae]|uniref:BCNT-C domain-containing protein n=1 Tax=Escallonia herrerae TaxID=1293975 RepID=A0AA89AV23_9ASTE|nr:hypothetical protein RJ639_007490 [Escallonia herrerae]